jgi:nicotinamide-nucleotide amidase
MYDGVKLATAESCTGGLIASKLTAKPGASAFFAGGVVAYTREVKAGLLDVPEDVIGRYGMVSEEVALAMARGVCRVTGAELGLATTGLAGPDGDGSGVPIGTVCIALYDARAGTGKAVTRVFDGGREQVRESAAQAALEMIKDY